MSDHGYNAYTRGCRCSVCREAKRLYIAQRRQDGLEIDLRPRHGQPRVRRRKSVRVEGVATHVRLLVDEFGWNAAAIARAAGIDAHTVHRLLNAASGRIHRRTADAVLAVFPEPYQRPNWKRVVRACRSCGTSFTVRPCEGQQRYCSHRCAGRARASLPNHVHLRYSDADLIEFLRRAAVNGVVTVPAYRKWAVAHDAPTDKTIATRFGGWTRGVERAGLSGGRRCRPEYVRRWTEPSLLAFVADAYREGVRTVADYEAWSRAHDGAPSRSLLAMRMGRWSEIVARAVESDAA